MWLNVGLSFSAKDTPVWKPEWVVHGDGGNRARAIRPETCSRETVSIGTASYMTLNHMKVLITGSSFIQLSNWTFIQSTRTLVCNLKIKCREAWWADEIWQAWWDICLLLQSSPSKQKWSGFTKNSDMTLFFYIGILSWTLFPSFREELDASVTSNIFNEVRVINQHSTPPFILTHSPCIITFYSVHQSSQAAENKCCVPVLRLSCFYLNNILIEDHSRNKLKGYIFTPGKDDLYWVVHFYYNLSSGCHINHLQS